MPYAVNRILIRKFSNLKLWMRSFAMETKTQTYPQPSIPTFFALAFAISWAFWGLAIIAPGTTWAVIGYYGGGFGPFIAALITVAVLGKSPWVWFKSLWRCRVAPRFWAFALLFPVAMALAASMIFGVAGGQTDWADAATRLALWPAAFATVTLVGGGNEELGWRGLALPALQDHMSPMVATSILGVLWAAWHIPLIAVTGGGWDAFRMSGAELLPVAITFLSVTAHAFWYTWLYNHTGSVLLCVLLHGGYNAANHIFIFVPLDALHGPDELRLLIIMTGLLVTSVGALIIATKGQLGHSHKYG
jgi:membrane protease YdiL (CAAX protease family)